MEVQPRQGGGERGLGKGRSGEPARRVHRSPGWGRPQKTRLAGQLMAF